MSSRSRIVLLATASAVLGALLVHGLAGLPAFGGYHGVYGADLNRITVSGRHATDVITAVNFDYRALDTMGEEFILFAASVGLVVLLREQRDEHPDPERPDPAEDPAGDRADTEEQRRGDDRGSGRHHTSPALLAVGRWLVGPLLVLGVYIDTHGQLTPGGGFQAGVVLATAVILVFVAGGRVAMAPIRPTAAAGALEAVGAGGYVALGIAGLIAGMRFLSNFLPLGSVGSLLSSGTIESLSVIVGLEVAGALTVIVSEFVDQRLLVRGQADTPGRPPGG